MNRLEPHFRGNRKSMIRITSSGALASLIACIAIAACEAPDTLTDAEVRTTLREFLDAFENGDYTAMQSFFADEANSFPSTVTAPGYDREVDLSRFLRVDGLPPGMERVVRDFSESGEPPPFISLQPQDLLVQIYGPAAVATLHFTRSEPGGYGSLGRRTFVLAKQDDGSVRIVHLHPSNVVTSWPPLGR